MPISPSYRIIHVRAWFVWQIDFSDFRTAFATLAKKRLSPDKELLERSFVLGLHLFCGSGGASLNIAKYCQEVSSFTVSILSVCQAPVSVQLVAVDFDCFFRPLEKREHRRKTAAAQTKEEQDRASASNFGQGRKQRTESINAVFTGPDDPFQDPECLFRDDLRNIQVRQRKNSKL